MKLFIAAVAYSVGVAYRASAVSAPQASSDKSFTTSVYVLNIWQPNSSLYLLPRSSHITALVVHWSTP